MHEEVCRRGFSAKRNSFVRDFDSAHLDASLLRLPLVGFLSATDPRIRGTLEAVGKHLARDGLIYRHRSARRWSAVLAKEPAILVCTLWYADALALTGRKHQAIDAFERVLALRNDLGLLSEGFDARAGQLSGNFPQTLSHLAVINTALNLAGPQGPAWRRSETAKTRRRS